MKRREMYNQVHQYRTTIFFEIIEKFNKFIICFAWVVLKYTWNFSSFGRKNSRRAWRKRLNEIRSAPAVSWMAD